MSVPAITYSNVAHELGHAFAMAVTDPDSPVRFIKIEADGCQALHNGTEDNAFICVVGGIAEAIAAATKPESICKALLMKPVEVGEIVVKTSSPSDWEAVEHLDPAGIAHAVRTAVLVIHALDSKGALSHSCEFVADEIDTQVGMLTVNLTDTLDFLVGLCESAGEAASLPDQVWSIPNFAEEQLSKFDLGLEHEGEGWEGCCIFSPMSIEMLNGQVESREAVLQ